MKIDIGTPNSMHVKAMVQPWEHELTGTQVGEAIALADELGFNKCMMGEHFVIPKEHIELSGDHYFHTVVALAFLGGQTKNIRLGTSVSIVPLQNPIVQAKAWSTLDWLTEGRAEAMFGVGWLKEEFDILGVDFHKRGRMADEYVAAMIELWTKDDPVFEGEFVNFRDVGFGPRPIQGKVPIWFGGDAEGVLKRVAKFGDGWSPFRTPPEKFPECIDFIKSQPEYDGRPLSVFFSLEMLNVGAHHEVLDDPRAPGTRDLQQVLDRIAWLEELGVTNTIVSQWPGISNFDQYKDWLRWTATDIMPKVA